MEEVGCDPYVECVAVVLLAGDEGICDGVSGVLRKPLKYLAQHAYDVKAG